MKLKISVIIPTYKRSERLGRAIDSVLRQSYSNIEVIVVDDNTEGDRFRLATEKFMQKYKGNSQVIYLKHAVNKNGSAARNTGVKVATGEYIAFLDDDDYFEVDKLKMQINVLNSVGSAYGGICCEHYSIYEQSIYKEDKVDINSSGNYTYDLLSGSVVLAAGSTLLIKKDVFNVIGYFDESYQRHQDYEFLLRFFRKYKLAIVNAPLVKITSDGARNYPSAFNFEKLKEKFLEDFKQDIELMEPEKKAVVLFKQWSEVLLYYAAEFDINQAKRIYNIKMKSTGVPLRFSFILRVIYILMERKIPSMIRFKYKLASIILKMKSKT